MSPKNIIIYTRDTCEYCVAAKDLLNYVLWEYKEFIIGEDVSRDDVKAMYPSATLLPVIVIDGVYIGGYKELMAIAKRERLV